MVGGDRVRPISIRVLKDKYRSLSLNGKLFFAYLWVILAAVVAMGGAAFFSLNTYQAKNLQALNRGQLSRIAGDISYNLRLSSRLMDILFSDMTISRTPVQAVRQRPRAL
jgi:hypothetical protein